VEVAKIFDQKCRWCHIFGLGGVNVDMKLITILIVLLFMVTEDSFSQWERIGVKTTNQNAILVTNHVWIMQGYDPYYYRSTDYGVSWTPFVEGLPDSYFMIPQYRLENSLAGDNTFGLSIGGPLDYNWFKYTAFLLDDSGQKWKTIYPPGRFDSVYASSLMLFENDTIVYVLNTVDPNGIYNDRCEITINYDTSTEIYGLPQEVRGGYLYELRRFKDRIHIGCFRDSAPGVSPAQGRYYSDDKGRSWAKIPELRSGHYYYTYDVLDSNIIIAVVATESQSKKITVITTDCFRSSDTISTDVKGALGNEIKYYKWINGHLFMCRSAYSASKKTAYDAIYYSPDTGKLWRQLIIDNDTARSFREIHGAGNDILLQFFNISKKPSVLIDKSLKYKRDVSTPKDFSPYMSILAVSDDIVFAYNQYPIDSTISTIVKSTDMGISWQNYQYPIEYSNRSSPWVQTPQGLYSLAMRTDSVFVVLHSSNNGDTWDASSLLPQDNSWNKLFVVNDTVIVWSYTKNNALYSIDRGNTWKTLTGPNTYITFYANNGTILSYNDRGELYKKKNIFDISRKVNMPEDSVNILSYSSNGDSILLFGCRYRYDSLKSEAHHSLRTYISTDRGASIQPFITDLPDSVFPIMVRSDNKGVMYLIDNPTGYSQLRWDGLVRIYRSFNSGRSWELLSWTARTGSDIFCSGSYLYLNSQPLYRLPLNSLSIYNKSERSTKADTYIPVSYDKNRSELQLFTPLSVQQMLRLEVFDINGKSIPVGQVRWENDRYVAPMNDVSTGAYVIRATTEGQNFYGKIMVIR
jgi:hypothetical protein